MAYTAVVAMALLEDQLLGMVLVLVVEAQVNMLRFLPGISPIIYQ
jgi:hypothetical protein